MTKSILINVGAAEVRVAVVENHRLQQLFCTPVLEGGSRNGASRIGDIVLGRVTKLVPAIQAAFVDVGMDKAGFLGAREAQPLAQGRNAAPDKGISGFIREGDTVLVQIVKDVIGEKGARLTAAVTLPGRLLVLTPQQPGICVSRRITDEAEHRRLEALGQRLLTEAPGTLTENAGFILRTSAFGTNFEALWEEAKALSATWCGLMQNASAARPPQLLYSDCGPVERALRDLAHEDTDHIVLDNASAVESARTYCRQSMPEMETRIILFTGPGTLFDRDEIENDILALSHRRVTLPSGGWIMLEGTEALTAVDVNSGHYTNGNYLENTSLHVNLEAAHEIGRQVRLRGIGGVIVIDFIHLTEPEHMASVTAALEQSLSWDGSPAIVAPPSPFGLVEVARKRVREPYEKRIGETCPNCYGEAHLRRPAAVAHDVIRRIEAAAQAAPGASIMVTAAAEVIAWLTSQQAALRPALAARGAVTVQFTARTGGDREAFDVETVTR